MELNIRYSTSVLIRLFDYLSDLVGSRVSLTAPACARWSGNNSGFAALAPSFGQQCPYLKIKRVSMHDHGSKMMFHLVSLYGYAANGAMRC